MGGEWRFAFIGGKSTFDFKSYRQLLLQIRKYESYNNHCLNKGEMQKVTWSSIENIRHEQEGNIFAKFTYKCGARDCHKSKIGQWCLYWDPTVVENPISDIHTCCATCSFIDTSLQIQKMLCSKFPNHFQLYLGSGTYGHGPESDEYFGVIPEGHKVQPAIDHTFGINFGKQNIFQQRFTHQTLERCTDRDSVIKEQNAQLHIVSQCEQFGDKFFSYGRKVFSGTRPDPHREFSPQYLGSASPIQVNRLNIIDLKKNEDAVLYNQFFLCRNITPPSFIKSIQTVVEDPEGVYAIRMTLDNYASCGMFDDFTKIIPIGKILLVRNPWFKYADGAYSLHCGDPSNVITMDEKIFPQYFPGVSWNGKIPEEYAPLPNIEHLQISNFAETPEALKAIGNKYFAAGKYIEALQMYNSGLELLPNNTDDLNILSNRAAAYLKLTWFSLALRDSECVLEKDPSHMKAIYRKSKALCGLNNVEGALSFLKDKPTGWAENSPDAKIMSAEIKKINSMKIQLSGKYNIETLKEKSKEKKRLEDMLEYKGSVEKGSCPGMFATKDIKKGEVVLASRAFEIVFDRKDFTPETEESQTRVTYSEDHMQLFSLIKQRINHDPKCMSSELLQLYAGPEMEISEVSISEDIEIDFEQIHSIIRTKAAKSSAEREINFVTGLWTLPSLINRNTITFNTSQVVYGDFMFVTAVKTIAKGDQILLDL